MLKFQSKSLSLICLSFLLFFHVPVSAETTFIDKKGEKSTLSNVAKGDSLKNEKEFYSQAVGNIYPGEKALAKIETHFNEWQGRHATSPSVFAIRAKSEDGKPVGILIYELGNDKSKAYVQLRVLAVKPGHQRLGIGTLMIQEIKTLYPKITEIRADIRRDNGGAKAFYEKTGFRPKASPNDPKKTSNEYMGFVLKV